MKMGCLLVESTSRQFWILCENCEHANGCYTENRPLTYRFFTFTVSQFPEYFGQTCFVCNTVLKSGPKLYPGTPEYITEMWLLGE